MIYRLRKKIFYILMISLSIILISIIILFSFLNYINTLDAEVTMLDRFSNFIGIKPDARFEESKPFNGEKFEGIYHVIVKENKIIRLNGTVENNEELNNYALKFTSEKKFRGFVEDYTYKIIRLKNGEFSVIFSNSKNAISRVRKYLIYSIIFGLVGIFGIYIFSKKISYIIVKPVYENFEKQKQFISDASHEFKTPLAIIEANADLLNNDLKDNKWLGYIEAEVESMNRLINQLLYLSRTENVEDKSNYEKFNLSNEVEMACSVFESMIYENKIRFETDIKENFFYNGNKEDFNHIVMILIDNAIKHTAEGGRISINLFNEENMIILRVENDGDPIPENERERIFERFYRVDKGRNRNEKRYGLGLAIAKALVQKYGGNISVDCKDGITSFKVEVPK